MTALDIDTAWAHDDQILRLTRALRAEYPCEECSGRGQGNHESSPYPEPCTYCWGRGYRLPEED